MLKNFIFAIAALFFTTSQGQNPHPPDPPLPVEKFKTLAFEPPAPDILAALRIPFLDGNRYGIADSEGKILLEPQFEDIEMMDRDLPFFKAKKGGKWSVFSLEGRQVLPFSVGTPYELILDWQPAGSRFDENGMHIERLMTKIKDPRKTSFTDPSGAMTTAFGYFFLNKKTQQPYRSWFAPDHLYFIRSTRDRWMMGSFTSDFNYGNLKIMDENGRFGFLDCDGNLFQSPVRNCATIGNADKILILNDDDRIALRDVKKGWQTDFLFNNVETTPEPGLFLGEFYEKGKPTRLFQIDSTGRVTPIEGMTRMEWNEKMPKSARKPDSLRILQEGADAVLIDPRDGREIFRITDGRIPRVELGGFVVEKDKKYGLFDLNGKQLLPIEFDKLISNWRDRTVIAIKNGLNGYFDLMTGREILPVEWPYLNRGGFAYGRSVGVVIRSGKNFVWLTKNLEVMHQQGPDKPIKKSNFRLSENTPPAAVADYEKVVMPELITSLIPMEGPGWLHIFRCDGSHVTSIETGSSVIEQVFFSHHERYLDTGNNHFTGFVKVRLGIGKGFYVRMADGKIFKK